MILALILLVLASGVRGRGHPAAVGAVGSADEPTVYPQVFLPWAQQPNAPHFATSAAATRTAGARALTTPTFMPSATRTASPAVTSSPTGPPASATATELAAPTSSAPSPTGTDRPPTPAPTATPTPAYALRDPSHDSLRPRAALRSALPELRFEPGRQTYVMRGLGDGVTAVYEVDMGHPDVRRGRLAVREAVSGRFPLAGAGLYYRRIDGRLVAPRDFDPSWPVVAVAHGLVTDAVGASRLAITVTEQVEGLPHAKRYDLAPVGGALRVDLRSLDGPGSAAGRYAGAGGSWIEGAREAVAVRIPFMEAVPLTLLDGRWFASTLLDLPRSRAGEILPRGPEADGGAFVNEASALYPPDAAGTVSAVSETLWITLSPLVDDAFAEPPGPVAPHRAALASAAHVRLGGRAPAVTADDKAAYVERLAGWGVTDLIVHDAGWADPRVPPPSLAPDAAAGGPDAARRLAAIGRLAPTVTYTLTVAGCPDDPNPAYRAADRVTGRDGQPAEAEPWPCAGGSPASAWLLAPDGALRVASANASTLGALGAAGVTLGDIGSWNPTWPWPGAVDSVVDRGAPPTHPATIGAVMGAYAGLFQLLQREVGPVFGDGAPELVPELRADAFYAGYLDGFSPVLAGPRADGGGAGAHGLVMPDYALLALRPRAAAYGFGPLDRFFGHASGTSLSDADVDRYRALLLAYGHAAAWEADDPSPGGGVLTDAQIVSLYALMRPLQVALQAADAVRVRYVGPDGQSRDLTRALIDGIDLTGPRLVIETTSDTGLALWINLSDNVWRVDAAGTSWLLPADGWVAEGANIAGYSALVDGRRIDRMVTPGMRLLDGRGVVTTVAGETARDLRIRMADGRTLEEQPDGSLRWFVP